MKTILSSNLSALLSSQIGTALSGSAVANHAVAQGGASGDAFVAAPSLPAHLTSREDIAPTTLFGGGCVFAPRRKKKDEKTQPQAPQAPRPIPTALDAGTRIFAQGIRSHEDLPLAFDLISAVHPRWKAMVDTMDRLRTARIEREEVSEHTGESFAITLDPEGSYCYREGHQYRRTDLASGINIHPGSSIFSLIHELAHALPLEELPSELSSLPYRGLEDLTSQKLAFDQLYERLLAHAYQDEAIAALAEVLLYRDLKKAGVDPEYLGVPEEREMIERMLTCYEQEGLYAYLRSELYVGRNHRSSYNRTRLVQTALLASCDPSILNDPSVGNVLAEQGLAVKGAGKIQKGIERVKAFLADPSPEAAIGIVQGLQEDGFRIEVDLETMVRNVTEAVALISGVQEKASVSFLGKTSEIEGKVQLLAHVRRHFESMTEPSLARFRLANLFLRGAEEEDRKILAEKAVVPFDGSYMQTLARVDAALWSAKDLHSVQSDLLEAVAGKVTKAFCEDVVYDSAVRSDCTESGSGKEVLDPLPMQCLTEVLQEPVVRQYLAPLHLKSHIVSNTTGDDFHISIYEMAETSNCVPVMDAVLQSFATLPRAEILTGLLKVRRQDNIDHSHVCSYADLELMALQAACLFTTPELPKTHENDSYYRIFVNPALREEFTFRSKSIKVAALLEYPLLLAQLRSGGDVDLDRVWREPKAFELDGFNVGCPVVFWLGDEVPYAPEGVGLYPEVPNRYLPQGIQTTTPQNLIWLHLLAERVERFGKAAMPKDMGMKIQDVLQTLLGQSDIWIATQLVTHLARSAAQCGEEDVASMLHAGLKQHVEYRMGSHAESVEWSLAQDYNIFSFLQEAHEYAELERRLLPLCAPTTMSERHEVLKKLEQEYEAMVRNRRSGFRAAHIVKAVSGFAKEKELRPYVVRLLELAVEHAATLGTHTPEFRSTIGYMISALHTAAILHEDKERLMAKLLGAVIPKREHVVTNSALSFQRAQQHYEMVSTTYLSDHVLSLLPLYPAAEQVVYHRTQEILEELSSLPLTSDMLEEVMRLAARVARSVATAHPEIIDSAYQERLARVSNKAPYRMALADLFPSRQVQVNLTLSPEQWSSLQVRRGLEDQAAAWEGLRKATQLWLEQPQAPGVEEPLLKVFGAFLHHEVETKGRTTDLITEATELSRAFFDRRQEMASSAQPGLRTALTLYSSGLRILSRREEVLLEDLASLPSVQWVLEQTEKAFAAGRVFTPREMALWKEILSAPTYSDAARKRELALQVMSDERFPLALRRDAALLLSCASHSSSLFETLIAGYVANGDASAEVRFYDLIARYWQRIGTIPSPMGVLALEEYGASRGNTFWNEFDQSFEGDGSGGVTELKLELCALKKGSLDERFVTEVKQYLELERPERSHFVFRGELEKLLPQDRAARKALLPIVDGWIRSRRSRQERLEIVRQHVPPAFVRLPAVLRFLAVTFLQRMPQRYVPSIMAELREMSGDCTDAEIFRHFFKRVGLEKVGQYLSTMVGIIPDDARRTFAELQDGVPAGSFEEVKRTIEQEIGQPLTAVFASFEENAMASASIGEVYRATLRDGSPVVVKVSPPSKRHKIGEALHTLKIVAEAYAKNKDLFESAIDVEHELLNFSKQLEQQMQFGIERRNAWSNGGDGEGEVAIPQYVMTVPQGTHEVTISTDHVSVMRPVEGVKIAAVTDVNERRRAAANYVREALRMLLQDGTYHADPHPANIFWNASSGRTVWLDWGVLGSIKGSDRELLTVFMVAASAGGAQDKIEALRAVAQKAPDLAFTELQKVLEHDEAISTPKDGLSRLLDLAGKQGIYLKPPIMRAIAFLLTVKGVVHDLDPERDFAQDFTTAVFG